MKTSLLRSVAWAIAIAGVIDPMMTMTRASKPEIALTSDARLPDPQLIDRIEVALRSRFTVIRGPSLGAAAVVSVGYQMPPDDARALGRGFAVLPEPRSPFAAIAAVSSARQYLLQARTPVNVRVRTAAAVGRTLTVALRRQDVLVDQVTRTLKENETVENIELQFVPATTGQVTLTVEARIDGEHQSSVDLTRSVRDERFVVLFFDRRPSWMSTFVRRALEKDPRFIISSRVATSRTAATTAGQPPLALSQLPALELFQTVVVGAPEDLTDSDAIGLGRFMRERSGTVVLLMDQPDSKQHSAAFRTLTGISEWRLTERGEPWSTPLASAVLMPTAWPRWFEAVASGGAAGTAPASPTIWRTAIGRGSLVVSGGLDAWRYRDRKESGFSSNWRQIIAAAAESSAADDSGDAIAPSVSPDERELIRAWTQSRGGQTFGESALNDLTAALDHALKPAQERRPWRPMQSPWWMVPFAMALGGEWWLRRRSGLR